MLWNGWVEAFKTSEHCFGRSDILIDDSYEHLLGQHAWRMKSIYCT